LSNSPGKTTMPSGKMGIKFVTNYVLVKNYDTENTENTALFSFRAFRVFRVK